MRRHFLDRPGRKDPAQKAPARGAGVALFLGLLLSACATGPGRQADVQTLPSEAEAKTALAPAAAEAEVEAQLSAESQALLETPEGLTQLDREGLRLALGEPSLLRRDRTVEIWQYRGTSCVLDVVLYEGEGVAHAEARRRLDAEVMDIASCLEALLDEKRQLETAQR